MSNLFRSLMLFAICSPLITGCATARKFASTHDGPSSTRQSHSVTESLPVVDAEPSESEREGTTNEDVIPVSHDAEMAENSDDLATWDEQPSQNAYSLVDLQSLAMQHNPAIREAIFAVNKAAGVRTQVGLRPNPEFGYSGQQIGDDNSAGQNGAFIEQTWISADKLNWNRAVIDQDVQSLLWEVEAQRYRVRTDVRLKFYDALLAQQRQSLAREFHEVAAKGVEIAQKRFDALEGAKPDVLQAEIQLNEVDLIIRRAELEFEAAWNSLVAIAGVPNLQPCPLIGELGPTHAIDDVELVYRELASTSPQLQAARARVDRARTNIGRQNVQAIPNLTAQLGVGSDDATGDEYANVQLSVPLPIHNYNQGNERAAQAEYCRAVQDVRRLELLLRSQLMQVMQDYRVSQITIERYENSIIPKAQETLELSEQAYEIGEFDFLRVLTVRREFYETNLEYVQALASAAKAEAKIDGMLLTGGLETAPQYDGEDGLRGQALSGQ